MPPEDGIEKAAVLLISLGEERAAEVLKHVGPREVQKIGHAMAALKSVPRTRVEAVAATYADLGVAPGGRVVLHTCENSYEADAVVLATGWNENVMAHPFLSGLARDYDLPTVVHGTFPDLDEALCWKAPEFPPTLHVAGLPAQLVVGPAGRNFVGARFAAKAIMSRM